MIENIKNTVLELRQKNLFTLQNDKVIDIIEKYSRFRRKSHLEELKKVIIESLNDGNLRVFEGAPGTGKSKVIHVYALLGLIDNKNIIISSHTLQAAQKMADFIKRLATGVDINYKNKIKSFKFNDLKNIKDIENCIFLIDESGFFPMDVADSFLKNANNKNAIVIMVGDLYQIGLKPEKNSFKQVINILHQNNYKTHELQEIFRQRNPNDVKAIHNIRKGLIKKTFDYYYKKNKLYFFNSKNEIISKLIKDINQINPKDYIIIASNYKIQKNIKNELENNNIQATVMTPKEVQGMAVNQTFFIASEKNINISELLVAFSRHKYKMKIYVDKSCGHVDTTKLAASINLNE